MPCWPRSFTQLRQGVAVTYAVAPCRSPRELAREFTSACRGLTQWVFKMSWPTSSRVGVPAIEPLYHEPTIFLLFTNIQAISFLSQFPRADPKIAFATKSSSQLGRGSAVLFFFDTAFIV